MYLVAIIDVYSRYIVGWSISNTMDASWVVAALKSAIETHGAPEIINSDQGGQFTGIEYVDYVNSLETTKISMDGKGRAHDNIFVERLWRSVKYECVYLNGYQSIPEARDGLENYFEFYNKERFHQALNYKTPCEVYDGENGGYKTITEIANSCCRSNVVEFQSVAVV